MWKRDHHYFVYLVSSRSHVLYCGMTENLTRRMAEHRNGWSDGFSAQYRCERLVWFEQYHYVLNAIAREKQIKRWRREKKITLIEKTNPAWADLSDDWRE